jgi:hypothetical protein
MLYCSRKLTTGIGRSMQLQQPKKNALSLYLKFGALVFLLFLSVLIAACSSNGGSSQLNPGTPVATVTINLNQFGGSPTPPLKAYYCGGWATDTTPAFNPNSIVNVYGKFIHNDVDGNPEGVRGATATATILWPDGTSSTLTATTTSDGLAVFPVAIKANSLFKEVLVRIDFQITSSTGQVVSCTVPLGAAFFTPIQASPTPTSTAMPSATPSVTPSVSPTAGGTTTPTTTPSPTPTTKPGH